MTWVPIVKAWIWISALATLAAWVLSAAGQLNRIGYVVFFGLALTGFFVWRKLASDPTGLASTERNKKPVFSNGRKFRRRFGRLLPGGFAVLACLIFIGGGQNLREIG